MHTLVLKTFTMIIPPKYIHKTPSIIIKKKEHCVVKHVVSTVWQSCGDVQDPSSLTQLVELHALLKHLYL